MAIEPFKMSGQTGRREEIGIVTWTVPWFSPDLNNITLVGADPPVTGLKETGRTWSGIEGSGETANDPEGFRVDVTYEGYIGDDIESETAIYEYDSSFSEETLTAHPEWAQIAELYSGTYDEETKSILFPATLDSVPKDRTFGLKLFADGDGNIKNPLFNVETFLAFGAVFRKTYLADEIIEELHSNVGTTVDELPGGFPTPSGRNWLIMPPKINQRGNFFEITEELMLSPIGGGWPEAIYKFIEGTT